MKQPLIAALFFALVSCSGPAPTKTETKKEPPKPAEPAGAQKAFFQMYGSARTWAPDVSGFIMQSITTPGMPAKEGKYAAWRGEFVSLGVRGTRTFTYSAVNEDGLSKGISKGGDNSYTGPRGQNSEWPVQALKIDSDAAYRTAMTKGKGEEYSKKHPEIPVTMVLEKTKRHTNPVYRVIWGASANSSSFSVYVDASSGEYLETTH